jgi:hypothetical protein
MEYTYVPTLPHNIYPNSVHSNWEGNVLMSLTQLVWTMHKIYKVRDSNPGHHQKKIGKEKLGRKLFY